MFKIKMKDIDEICELTIELETLTYLLGLVNSDGEEFPSLPLEHRDSIDGARYYLWDKQQAIVLRLRELLGREDLLESSSNED